MLKKQMTSQCEPSSSHESLNHVSKRHRDESDDDCERRTTDRNPSGEAKMRKYNEDEDKDVLQHLQAWHIQELFNVKRENKSLRQENEELRRQLRMASKKEDKLRRTMNLLERKTTEQEETVKERTEEARQLRADLAEKKAKGDYFQDVLVNLRESIEKQFTCSVCTEVMIKANTLHCGHTFCSDCLEEWDRLNPSCPICRAAIKCKHPTKLVDDHIDYFVEHFHSADAQNSRSSLVRERIRRKEERAQDPLSQRAYRDPINVILRQEWFQIPRTVQIIIMRRVFDELTNTYINPAAGQQG